MARGPRETRVSHARTIFGAFVIALRALEIVLLCVLLVALAGADGVSCKVGGC